jgi:ParB/RepB/Spo0J family partition protein
MAAVGEAIQTGIIDIPLSRLFVALWNARKTFDESALADLTASIQQHGIQVPLIVRPIMSAKRKESGDYEIIAGHRRHRGAERSGKADAPCIVRDLSDDEAREIGMVDNLQREDLAPMEEAKAFGELLKGSNVESVAAKLGKDPSFVARRLKLLSAIPPVQAALEANAIEVGHALELARLDEKQQAKLFTWLGVVAEGRPAGLEQDDEEDEDACPHGVSFDEDCERCENGDDGETEEEKAASPTLTWRQTGKSVAELRRQIGATMLRVLNEAPFPLEQNIAPLPCTECPKRTINSTLLFSDVSLDSCTDSECYGGKVRAWVRYSLQYAEENGKKLVLVGHSSWYDKTEDTVVPKYNVKLIEDGKDDACESQEDAIWYDGPRAGHAFTICRNTNCKTHYGFQTPKGGRSGNTSAQNAAELVKQQKERKQTLAKVNVQKRYRNALFIALGQAKAPTAPSAVIDQLAVDIVSYCITRMTSIYNSKLAEALGWDEKLLGYGTGDKLVKHLVSLPMGERLRAAHLAIQVNDLAVHEYSVNSRDYRPAGFERLAQLLSVDHKALLLVELDRQAEKQKAAVESAKKRTEKEKKAAKNAAKPAEAVKADAKPAKKTPTTKAAKQKPAAKGAKKATTKKTAKAKK